MTNLLHSFDFPYHVECMYDEASLDLLKNFNLSYLYTDKQSKQNCTDTFINLQALATQTSTKGNESYCVVIK